VFPPCLSWLCRAYDDPGRSGCSIGGGRCCGSSSSCCSRHSHRSRHCDSRGRHSRGHHSRGGSGSGSGKSRGSDGSGSSSIDSPSYSRTDGGSSDRHSSSGSIAAEAAATAAQAADGPHRRSLGPRDAHETAVGRGWGTWRYGTDDYATAGSGTTRQSGARDLELPRASCRGMCIGIALSNSCSFLQEACHVTVWGCRFEC
jgi:hypothetical protein